MKSFKFLTPAPLVHSHDGYPIYAGDLFYSVAKENITLTYLNGREKVIQKYGIATRWISKVDKNRFRPNHELFWYFKSKSNAEWLIEHWKRDDGIAFHGQADITLTFRR